MEAKKIKKGKDKGKYIVDGVIISKKTLDQRKRGYVNKRASGKDPDVVNNIIQFTR